MHHDRDECFLTFPHGHKRLYTGISVHAVTMPPRLYTLCLEVLIPLVEKLGEEHDWKNGTGPLDNLGKDS
jgi:hypothetical protein